MLDQDFHNKMNYFAGVRDAMNYDTVWSIYEAEHAGTQIFTDKVRRVFYRFYTKDVTTEQLISNTAQMAEVSTSIAGGSVRDLWAAAEELFQQAKAAGDWHYFIEDFKMQDDGSLELTMGS